MPAYLFECNCGEHKEVFRPIAEASKKVRCPKCKKNMYRDFGGEAFADHCWKQPRVSEAAGVHISQVGEEREAIAKRGLTGVSVRDDGCMEFASQKAEKAYLRTYHMHNRGYL